MSVVIASKDRPELLSRAVATLRPQIERLGGSAEVIVVDDGSTPPYDVNLLGVHVVRGKGRGPARARNLGVEAARGEVVAFTDDDVIVADDWVDTILRHFNEHPTDEGVTGLTTAPPHDSLYEHAVVDLVGGSFLTCNVAYRRRAVVSVGGFDESFARAHEDRDLAWRVIDQVGPVRVCPEMRVEHPGRPFSVRQAWLRARFCSDDWLLFSRYPGRRAGRWSDRWTPLANHLRTWREVAGTSHVVSRPKALARWVAIVSGLVALNTWWAVVRYPALKDRDLRPVPGLRHGRLHIAYVGPSPDPAAGGAPGVAGLILRELLDLGCSIDCFVAASREDDDPRALGQREGLTYVISRSRFAFGKWYSRSRLTKMVSLQAFAAMSRRRLAREVAARHLASPYDVLYQFSTLESFGVPRRHRPPVAVHPSVHARGELRWVRREAQLGLSADSSWRRRAIETWLWLRSLRQRRDATRAERVLALSPIFGRELVADYGVDPRRVIVIPNCVDLSRILYSPPRSSDVAVIGRTAVRKGLEDVIALSRLLPDRLPNTHLRVIGSPSLWSDYSKGLASLDPRSSTWVGPRTRVEVLEEIAGSLAVLQLSRYEPFGLTVAEALARGVSVVVTPEVGAGEFVSADVKTVIRAGDIDALVSALVALAELRDDERELLSRRCRTEAERHFSPKGVALQVLDALEAASTPKTARPTHR